MTAIFVDRDGVINENRADYVKSWAEFRWLPQSLEALITLAAYTVPIFIVTNQSAVGRGLVPSATLDALHARMTRAVQERGGRIDGIYVCLHAPEASCRCRKPAPGLLFDAALTHGVDLTASVLIGDAFGDFGAARAAGTAYIHVRTGRGAAELPLVLAADPTVPVVDDLAAAARLCGAYLGKRAIPAA